MKQIAQLSDQDRSDLFAETGRAKGITAAAAEKDFWICWVLMHIFEHVKLKTILRFKGGTSLSKCFGLIERFSEDIDLILDWNEVTAEDPEQQRSKTQQNKLNKQINNDAQYYIRETILPALNNSMNGLAGLEIDENDGHTINVHYPTVHKDGYLRNEIRLEIGPLAHMLPFGSYDITSYAAEVFPKQFEQAQMVVDAIVPERTLWEKITILHAEAHRPTDKPQADRYSRHYYDVYRMLGTEIEREVLKNLDLLAEVVAFKQKFYPSAWARYDLAELATLKLSPEAHVRESLKKDYTEMQEMIFGESPDFETMMNEIAEFELRLNTLPSNKLN